MFIFTNAIERKAHKRNKRIIPAKKSVYLEGPKAAAMNLYLA